MLGSLSDWLFAGVLFHGRYQRHPEIWREGIGERTRIIVAQGFVLLTCTVMVLLAAKLHQTDLVGAVKLSIAIWLIGPLPLLLTNYLFIKIDVLVTASHAAGWMVKLLLIAGMIVVLLR